MDAGTDDFAAAITSNRQLNGHVFQLADLVPGPFNFTEFGTVTSAGYGHAKTGEYTFLNRELGGKEYPLIALGQGFDFSMRFTPDFGLRLSFGGTAYTGADALGALVAGTVGSFDLNGEFVIGHTWGSVRGALLLKGGLTPEYSVLLVNAVVNAVQNRSTEVDALVTTDSYYLQPGIAVAWGINRVFGLIGQAQYVWSQTTGDIQVTRQGYVLGGSIDADLNPAAHVPISIQAFTHFTTRWQSDGTNRIIDLGGTLFYTGRVPLQLGIEVYSHYGELRRDAIPNLTLTSAIARIVLRYYW
jgi:hypothetical protein